MERIRKKTEYIGSYQSVFRNGRSTTDIVWSHKWDIAKALTYRDEITISLLINVLEKILNKDKIFMIRELLTNTCLEVSKSTQTPFETNIGILSRRWTFTHSFHSLPKSSTAPFQV